MGTSIKVEANKSCQSGFSIMEIMVAMGLLGVMSMGIMRLLDNTSKAQKSIEMKSDVQNLHNQILKIMKDEASCTATINFLNYGLNVPSINILNSSNVSVPHFTVGQTVGKIKIEQIKLDTQANSTVTGNGVMTNLILTYLKTGNNFYGGTRNTYKIPVSVDNCQVVLMQDLKSNNPNPTQDCISQGGTPDGPSYEDNYGTANTYVVQVCRDCSVRTTFTKCY
jgi:prepilin-type N-terminal cleavage/methylation domain-containing protein